MPKTKTDLRTAPRGGSEHDFAVPREGWETAVFDNAALFAVVEVRRGRRRTEFKVLPWAIRYTTEHADDGACLYAVCETGRFALLDRARWPEWEARWRTAKGYPMLTKRPVSDPAIRISQPSAYRWIAYVDLNGQEINTSVCKSEASAKAQAEKIITRWRKYQTPLPLMQKPHLGMITDWETRSSPQGLGYCVSGRLGSRKVITTSILARNGDEVETLNWRYALGEKK